MRVIDSHTEGEPTRVVLDGGPDLGPGTLAERAARLEKEHLDFCASVVLEPRGHDAIIGALLVPPDDPACAAGVIYFNNLQNLGMCGHATIGLGVLIAALTGVGAWLAGRPFLTSDYGYLHFPPIEEFEWATAMAFDVGVFLTVVGAVMLALQSLSSMARRTGETVNVFPMDINPARTDTDTDENRGGT